MPPRRPRPSSDRESTGLRRAAYRLPFFLRESQACNLKASWSVAPSGSQMTRATLALLAFNQERFIDAAISSAVNQECEPIRVVLSDDASTDGTFARMELARQRYSGRHELLVRRSSRNLGIAGHINEIADLCSGQLIVMMAGDDISLPLRVHRTLETWDRSAGTLDLIACDVYDMLETGEDAGILEVDLLQKWTGITTWTQGRPYVIGASHAFTHRLWERFGPFQADLAEEDQVNTLRAICAGGARTIEEPLVRYRRGGLSSRRFSAADYHSIERKRNARFLGVVKQWRIDARTAGCEREVEDSIHWQIEREMFIAALLRTELLRQRIDLVQSSATGTAAWRWKRLVDVSFPRTSLLLKRLKGTPLWPPPPALSRCVHREVSQ
jgi:glycosyltransferase involved in cell wall biosynthesis